MSTCPPPLRPNDLACQRDPEQWFNRRRRRDTLRQCLQCPARPWCAQQALKWQASWGMWAAVWIDGRHGDAAPYLHAIAADDDVVIDYRPAVSEILSSPRPPAPAPLHRPVVSARARSTDAAVLARSCGHCEVFADGCRYTFDRIVRRHPGERSAENPSPTALFAACVACAEIVNSLGARWATRLGYVVNEGRDPASVPFYWRGSRWVLLDRDGWLTEVRADAQSA
ncbi:WhiB family transcriptional regulator [Mycobacterium sp. 050128]|uniref:WhiB family transcriptional regulator n=1 Tax=unclassified Mycobacterium TaxID=2642494 RepID=UPI002EDB1962